MGHKKTPPPAKASLRPRLRVMLGSEIALGPGRIDLLELIETTGSLRAAAERMGLSYMRAWQLIKYTNRCFRAPVVEVVRGGQHGGGAKLTETGRRTLAAYRRMEKQCYRVTKSSWTGLRKLLAKY
jgi:molybdate transport system regulatory protein